MKAILYGFLAFFALITLSMGGVQAQDGAVPEWRILAGDSRIEFEGTQMGAPFKGHFGTFSGRIFFDPANLAASSAAITIDTGSADAASPDRNKYLRMPDWFNVDAFPQARFVTTAIEKGLGNNQYVARGDLTIRDVTLPVVLPFTLEFGKADSGADQVKMTGETTINRLDYGVGQGQWTDTKTVENLVKLRVFVVAVKAE